MVVTIAIGWPYTYLFSMKTTTQTQPKPATQTKQPSQPITPPQPGQEQIQKMISESLDAMKNKFVEIQDHAASGVLCSNEALALAHSANNTTIKAYESAKEVIAIANKTSEQLQQTHVAIKNLEPQARAAMDNLVQLADQLQAEFKECAESEQIKAEKIAGDIAAALNKNNEPLENRIKVAQAAAEVSASIKSQGKLAALRENWHNFKQTFTSPKFLISIALLIVVTALCIYVIKYSLPILLSYLIQPHVIIETSKNGLLGFFSSKNDSEIEDLVFEPSLQTQLSELTSRVRYAKKNNEPLPNVLFHGVPGTGKTAFAKELARNSGLDYALTSGSEFAKIKNLNDANNELRKLLNWAKRSKGLIVFIDEAESMFANKRLPTTPKQTQDFINTFLSLVPDQSQKNVMFIFATNYPSKIDNAIINRMGLVIEFTLPGALERSQIFLKYLLKFAQEKKNVAVKLNLEFSQKLAKYSSDLEGFSPRAIKFIAESIIINTRRQKLCELTDQIVQNAINTAKNSQQNIAHDKERTTLEQDI